MKKVPGRDVPSPAYRLGYVEPRLLETSLHNTFIIDRPLSEIAHYRRLARASGNLVDRAAKHFQQVQMPKLRR